jgi:hypothetical protein
MDGCAAWFYIQKVNAMRDPENTVGDSIYSERGVQEKKGAWTRKRVENDDDVVNDIRICGEWMVVAVVVVDDCWSTAARRIFMNVSWEINGD